MAVVSKKALTLTLARHFSTLTSNPITLTPKLIDPAPSPNPNAILDLSNTEPIFSSISTRSLIRSLAILQTLSIEPLVDVGIRTVRSQVVQSSWLANKALMGVVKGTVYGHFCAGSGLDEVGRTVKELEGMGLKGILDYGSEDAEDGSGCDRNLSGFLEMVEMMSSLPRSAVSSACVKVTAICPISLLERISDLLRWQQKDPSLTLPWKSHSIPVLSDSSPLYQTPTKPLPLTETEELNLQQSLNRLSTLCSRCAELNLSILIDAEYSTVQPAIDYFTYSAALEFNKKPKSESAMVLGTVQCYLRDAKERLAGIVEAAEREGFVVGVKLVRGAYTREREMAAALGVESPIHGSIGETHRCYDECASFMLERIAGGSVSLVLATHNVESGKAAAAKAEELGISKGNRNLQFAQLMGMADGLSLGLKNTGFQVNKYLPYGTVDQVIPYLLRRAEENRGMLSASTLDRDILRKEIRRRMSAAVLGKN
ncbi:uncharacterized protein A4U43_C10F16170 [Asparagus officinalis]|uniref:Proline dehydrogenase n=1 Tax=Asparagus officinalis TaxID=4686 RepID=A0A5P1E6E7_ASPOF|nr:proline dehydrogenase 2, mitochondrial-like [Asparagus officinalis]ONK57057.1 uncharacterized protein A4U43_C10F16170 [Asparagus officinalis]